MSGNLGDLNKHLFDQLDRLGSPSLSGDDLADEVSRADSIVKVSTQVVNNAALQLSALKLQADHLGLKKADMPRNLLSSDK